mmetsp:Transcript_81602/g.214216  ORF Transcript_81602/g.214216 Transcript_81602/m.214216 type:complete len:191 (-) Transcript_81602:92-664(-)
MARNRGLTLPLLAAAFLAAWSAARAFVGAPSQVGLQAPAALRGDVAMRAKLSAKEKQAARSKERQGANDKKKKVGDQQWPVEIPEGVTVLHLEYGEDSGVFPQPGNEEVVKFYRAMNTRFGAKVRIISNYEKALQELSPTKTWRKGAFEVVDVKTKKPYYSKLASGVSLVNGKEEWMDKFLDTLAEKVEA